MIGVVVYLLTFLISVTGLLVADLAFGWLAEIPSLRLAARCGAAGCVGGILYCLRGVYLNAAVRDTWDPVWKPWYYLRPITSLISGAVSLLFLKAGLFLLEADTPPDAADFGYYALAFVAGLNVDRFVDKIEDLAQATWGIKKSRTADRENQ